MQTGKLGRTGLDVSRLTFGCGAVGGLMTKGRYEDQLRAVRRALEHGVNFFDTAPSYGNGASETALGRILGELQPQIVLGTKVRIGEADKGDIGAAINRSLDQSLGRLGRDRVDLLQLHNPITADGHGETLDPERVLGEVVPAFERLKAENRIGFFGLTAVGETPALLRLIDSRAFDTAQIVYNMLNPTAGGQTATAFPGQDYGGLLGRAQAAGMGTIAIRVLAGGALSGQETRHPLGMKVVAPIGSGPDYRTDVDHARRLAAALGPDAAGDLVATAIRYVAGNPDVSTLEVGIATSEEFEAAVAAVEKGALEEASLSRIAAVQSGGAGETG